MTDTATGQRATGPGIFEAIGRYRVAVALAVVGWALAGFFGSSLLPTTYAATASLVVGVNTLADTPAINPERTVQQEANRLASRAVFSLAADRLDGGVTTESLSDSTDIGVDLEVGLLEVTVVDSRPDDAAAIANAVVAAYQAIRQQAASQQAETARAMLEAESADLRSEIRRLEGGNAAESRDQLDTLRAQLSAIETRASSVVADIVLSAASTDDIELAIPPDDPAGPVPLRNAALAAVFGAALASAVAYWRTDVADRSRVDLETTLAAPLLAQIPRFGGGSDESGDPFVDPDAAEAFQFLLSSVEFVLSKSSASSILVTSALPGDGKSSTSLHLARMLAVQGRDVVLIDSDIRARGLTLALQASNADGLVELAEGEGDLDELIRRYQISSSVTLPVLAAGRAPGQPTGLLATTRYRKAVSRAIAYGDLAVVDSAPLLTVADASAVANEVDAIILVLDAGTAREDIMKVRERLRLIAVPLIGFVLNRVDSGESVAYPYRPAERSVQRQRSWATRLLPSASASKVGNDASIDASSNLRLPPLARSRYSRP